MARVKKIGRDIGRFRHLQILNEANIIDSLKSSGAGGGAAALGRRSFDKVVVVLGHMASMSRYPLRAVMNNVGPRSW